MQRKKFLAALLTGVLTLGAVIAYRTFGGRDLLFNAEAGKYTYTSSLMADDGPGLGAPHIGMIDTDIVTCYYSTDSDLTNDSLLVLSATDAKTPGVFLNLTVINGLRSVNVDFSGGTLYAIATETCFERFVPDSGDELVSEVTMPFFGEQKWLAPGCGVLLTVE